MEDRDKTFERFDAEGLVDPSVPLIAAVDFIMAVEKCTRQRWSVDMNSGFDAADLESCWYCQWDAEKVISRTDA
jgi:hypothetical protein